MSRPDRMKYDHVPLFQRYVEFIKQHRDEKKAGQALVKSLAPAERERAELLYSQTSFNRRRYPGMFYCWPMHELFNLAPIDPWPAANYPKAVLMAELLIRDQARVAQKAA